MIVLDEGDGDNKDDDYDEKCGKEKLKGGSTQTLWIAWCFASDTSPGRKLQKITRFFGQRRCVYNQQNDENDGDQRRLRLSCRSTENSPTT